MLFEQASYAFPTEWVVFLDVLATLAAIGVLGWFPRLGSGVSRLVWRGLQTLGRTPGRTAATLALAGGLGTATLLIIDGPPVPRIPDEKSYLLAADTYARGQWSFPTHPDHPHFITAHVLHEPVYASKYPPAQGLMLALGQRLGHPAVALAISSALLVWVIAWALAPALPPPWPLIGGLLAVLRLGAGSYWNQSYWGGSVAAIGGALVLGGLLRLRQGPRPVDAGWLILGLLVLAHSRPFEGLVYAATAGGLLLAGWYRRRVDRRRLTALVVVLAAGAGFIVSTLVLFNIAITGRPLVFPHQLHAHQFPEYLHFVWQMGPGWPREAMLLWLRKTALTIYFFLGTGPIIVLLLAAVPLGRRPTGRIAGLLAAAVFLALLPIRPFHAHYAAPLAAPLLLLAILALRAAQALPFHGRRLGRRLVTALLAVQLAGFLFQLPAHRPDTSDWSSQRATIDRTLRLSSGRDLVLVDYPHGRPNSWVWNDADIDASEVVWAESLGPQKDQALIERHPERKVWRLSPDFTPTPPHLVPVERFRSSETLR